MVSGISYLNVSFGSALRLATAAALAAAILPIASFSGMTMLAGCALAPSFAGKWLRAVSTSVWWGRDDPLTVHVLLGQRQDRTILVIHTAFIFRMLALALLLPLAIMSLLLVLLVDLSLSFLDGFLPRSLSKQLPSR